VSDLRLEALARALGQDGIGLDPMTSKPFRR